MSRMLLAHLHGVLGVEWIHHHAFRMPNVSSIPQSAPSPSGEGWGEGRGFTRSLDIAQH